MCVSHVIMHVSDGLIRVFGALRVAPRLAVKALCAVKLAAGACQSQGNGSGAAAAQLWRRSCGSSGGTRQGGVTSKLVSFYLLQVHLACTAWDSL